MVVLSFPERAIVGWMFRCMFTSRTERNS